MSGTKKILRASPGVSRWGTLAYATMFAGGAIQAMTGIITFLLGTPPMTHWVLMLHVGSAPLFAIGLAGVAITWSEASCFGLAGSDQSPVTKTLFWLILLCGLVVVLTGVVPMLPIFGSHGQHTLYITHRWTTMVFAGLAILHLLSLRRR